MAANDSLVRSQSEISRRRLLAAGVGATVGLYVAPLTGSSAALTGRDGLFSLGVASGPLGSRGVVLWTRLAPQPFASDGGMPPRAVPVRWEVALDDRFRRVVARGTEMARADAVHSIHAEVDGLRPGWEYWFRFLAAGQSSPVGRTKTLPARGTHVERFAFAFASCQRYEHGYFTAYRAMAQDEIDLIVHLGDYVYENAIPAAVSSTAPRAGVVPDAVRPEATDLAGYRLRHALYKTDPDLQRVHAHAPWAVILDNHDAVWDGDADDPPRNTLARRAAAYRAWWEHMPLPKRDAPRGPAMPIRRCLAVGDLLQLQLLDTRQFRDDEDICAAPPPNIGPQCAPILEESRSMLGDQQERWLGRGLHRSNARWNAVAQTVLMAPYDFQPGAGESYYLSGWDGYPVARRRLLDAIVDTRAPNPVILSGDWHTQWVNDLKRHPHDDRAPVVATELVGTAISSDPGFTASRSTPALADNPHVKYYSARNGYTRALLDHQQWHSQFIAVDAKQPAGSPQLEATHIIANGRPGAQTA